MTRSTGIILCGMNGCLSRLSTIPGGSTETRLHDRSHRSNKKPCLEKPVDFETVRGQGKTMGIFPRRFRATGVTHCRLDPTFLIARRLWLHALRHGPPKSDVIGPHKGDAIRFLGPIGHDGRLFAVGGRRSRVHHLYPQEVGKHATGTDGMRGCDPSPSLRFRKPRTYFTTSKTGGTHSSTPRRRTWERCPSKRAALCSWYPPFPFRFLTFLLCDFCGPPTKSCDVGVEVVTQH